MAGNFDSGGDGPIVVVGVTGLYLLATFLPWLGLVARRLQDFGLTGWLAIPCLVLIYIFFPTVLILGLIPSQGRENQWGPVPAGI